MALQSHQEPKAPGSTQDHRESCALEDILATEELQHRPRRTPDYQAENEALVALAKHMTETPETLLQTLSETALRLCRAGSAGVSLEENTSGDDIFRWRALAGRMEGFLGGTMPRDFSPCGITVDRGSAQLMREPVHFYPYIAGLQIPLKEVLLVPFFHRGKAVGTLWIVSHDETGVFDAEDARLMTSLSQFAASAVETLSTLRSYAETQLELEEVHFKLETALHAASISTWSWDIQKDRLSIDLQGAQLFGVSEADAQGGPISTYFDAIHPDDQAAVKAQITEVLENGDRYEMEYRVVNGDSVSWVIARGKVIRDSQGQPVLFPGVLVDITSRKMAQLDVENQQKQINEGIHIAHEQALASSKAKDDFLAALSHELRTPLNPALLLASEASKNTLYSEDARDDFEIIRKNIELEARLIDDLLDITRIANGKFVLYPAFKNLHDILHDAADKVSLEAQEKKITLTWNLAAQDATIHGDPVRLQQLFWNVLKNAVKFTPVGGHIHIESRNDEEDHSIVLQIQDDGIGMVAEEIQRIFETFAQGHHIETLGSHMFGGLGLGLAICKKIVEAHSGHISAVSQGKGCGSTFLIKLPNAASDEAKEDAPLPNSGHYERPAPVTTSLRILIVEDHAETRLVLQRLLIRRSHDVSVAASGEEAVALVHAQGFDLIVCDIGLPDMDGYTLLESVHQHRPALPAIAMTGYGMESDQERSAQAGFLAHLTKPVSLAALEDTLRGLSLPRYQE